VTIYHLNQGVHVHCRVFMNGANCGNLCFRVEEFEDFRRGVNSSGYIKFVLDLPVPRLTGERAQTPPSPEATKAGQ